MCDWNTLISHRRVCVCQVLLKWITLQLLSYVLFQESALHIAAQNGDLNWVKSLVDGGTDIDITDENEVSVWLNIYPNIPCNSSQLLAYAFTFLPPSEDSTACGSRKGLFWNREISCWKRGCCQHQRQKWSEYFRLKCCCWYELWVRSKNKERTLCSLLVDIYFRNLFKLVSTQACLVTRFCCWNDQQLWSHPTTTVSVKIGDSPENHGIVYLSLH